MKMKKILQLLRYLSFLLVIPFTAHAQGIDIPSGATVVVTGAATIEVIDGNLVNNGTYTKGGETFTMSGTSPAMISGTSLSDFNNLTVSNTGGVSIDVNTPVTVSGTLSNTVGAGGLILKSTSLGYGSLIHSSSSVQGRVERSIIGATWSEWNDGWHLLSSPVAAQSVSGDWTPAGAGNDYDFYAWSESALSDNWLNQKVAGNNINTFVTGQGYLVAYEQTDVKEFNGDLNYASVTLNGLTHTSGNTYEGWHLAGNPFTSALDWSTGSWTKTNLGAAAKIWVEADKSYKDVTTDYNNIIPAMNGIMVYVDEATTGTLTIPANARVHDLTNWLKSAPAGFIVLTARETEGNSAQETIIRADNNATNGFDLDLDSKFMAGFAPMLYSVAEGNYLSFNTLPDLDPTRSIDLGFVKNNATSYTIELSKENLVPGIQLFLTDKLTGVVTDLIANPVYHFNAADGDIVNRFNLQFAPVGIIENAEDSGPEIVACGKIVSVSVNQPADLDINICNLTGQMVRKSALKGSTSAKIDLSGIPAGVYIVSVSDGSSLHSTKIIL